ncbi:MAG: peptide chain release factor N(5)-glutamine methyltransferase [Pseudomonadota bacterium]
MIRVRNAVASGTVRLAGVSQSPRLDAELLAAHALGTTREAMLLSHLGDPVPDSFDALVERRLAHEPVAYITGSRDFWTIRLEVGPGVLVPRPDSEVLIEAAEAHFADRAPRALLDLGTGPGTLLLAALDRWPDASGLGVDRSETALGYARRNAERLGMANRASFSTGDWGADVTGRFDLILCNPPYIGTDEALPEDVVRFEPHEALYAGADGLDAYRRLIPDLRRMLESGGAAVLEIGWRQADAVGALADAEGFSVVLHRDLESRPRALVLT